MIAYLSVGRQITGGAGSKCALLGRIIEANRRKEVINSWRRLGSMPRVVLTGLVRGEAVESSGISGTLSVPSTSALSTSISFVSSSSTLSSFGSVSGASAAPSSII